jgi:rhodanese-related sulfurtransferase
MEQFIEFAGKHILLSGGFVVVLGILIWTEITRRTQGFSELTPVQAIPLINDKDTVVVDVSSSADFQQGHIVDARNLAVSRFSNPDAEVQKLAGKKVLVTCKNGQAAPATASAIVKLGAERVAVLKGGMLQWKADNYPTTNK